MIGKAKAKKNTLKESYEIYFFFPFYHTGGAEKVHAQIAQAFRGRKAIIIFTRKSHNEGFRQAFSQSGHTVLDISAYTDDKLKYWNNLIWRGLVAQHINNQAKKPVVFNGQCNFAYKCSPWIRKDVTQLELIHSFNSFSQIRIPFLPFYDKTVMISQKAISDHREQYKRIGVPETMISRIRHIRNGIPIPTDAEPKVFSGKKLDVLYAGRGTPEKRVHIVARIALQCKFEKLPVEFSFLGEVRPFLDEALAGAGRFLGNISDQDEVDKIFRRSDILVITSSEEGFPMVAMEAMSRGCIILATPVGDLPAHIHPGRQGFIFSDSEDEDKIIQDAVTFLKRLLSDRALSHIISTNNIAYAREHFGLPTFEEAYRQLIDSANNRN
jgi:glycosyltransferase involved in cell wall biosynthesis